MLRKDPWNILRFAELCQDVKHLRLALVRMGFWLHPAVLEKLQQEHKQLRTFSLRLRRWAIELLYHVDSATVFKVQGFKPSSRDRVS